MQAPLPDAQPVLPQAPLWLHEPLQQ